MCCKAPLLADFFFPLPKNPWFMLETVPIRNGLLRCQLRKSPTLSSLKLIVISSYLKWGNALLIREQLGLVTASTRLRNQCWGSLLLRYAGSLLHGSCCMGWRICGFGKGPTQLRVQVSDCCRADQKLKCPLEGIVMGRGGLLVAKRQKQSGINHLCLLPTSCTDV